MKTQQKAIVIALIGTLAVSSLTAVPAFAATSEPPSREAEVYVLEEEEAGTTTLRERGRCTDSYSKEWCDSHGFQNNRPVPHKGDCGRFPVHPTPGSRETAGTRSASASPASARCAPTGTTPSSGPARP